MIKERTLSKKSSFVIFKDNNTKTVLVSLFNYDRSFSIKCYNIAQEEQEVDIELIVSTYRFENRKIKYFIRLKNKFYT